MIYCEGFYIECDHCARQTRVEGTEYVTGLQATYGVDDSHLREIGWETDGDEHLCRDCADEFLESDHQTP